MKHDDALEKSQGAPGAAREPAVPRNDLPSLSALLNRKVSAIRKALNQGNDDAAFQHLSDIAAVADALADFDRQDQEGRS